MVWTNDLLLIEPLGANFGEIEKKMQQLSDMKKEFGNPCDKYQQFLFRPKCFNKVWYKHNT